jgi:hypothetical protein
MNRSKRLPRSKWTDLEKEFDKLIDMSESRDQVTRIDGRYRLNRFVEQHGKEACDAMWERIK